MRIGIAAAVLVLAGCVADDAPQLPMPAASGIFLPQQLDTPERVELAALSHGRLILRDGCFRTGDGDGSSLILWPPNVKLTRDGRGVIDPLTGTAVMEGDMLVMGGGAINGIQEGGTQKPIPAACTGPYWLGGSNFFPAPREEWRSARLSEKYSISVEQRMAAASQLPATLQRPGLKLEISEATTGCGLPTAVAGEPSWTYGAWSDQRQAKVLRQSGARETLDAVFEGIDQPRGSRARSGKCLKVHADCATGRDCDLARGMLSTIRFGDLGKPD